MQYAFTSFQVWQDAIVSGMRPLVFAPFSHVRRFLAAGLTSTPEAILLITASPKELGGNWKILTAS